ncbi:MAG: hypothetical protein ACI308_06015 [Muribaculaceae bacterium]
MNMRTTTGAMRCVMGALLMIVSVTAAAVSFDSAAVKRYFASRVPFGGEAEPQWRDVAIKPGRVGEYSQAVWELWNQACNDYYLDCLPMPDELALEMPYGWQLPAELEANARMPFYFGYKGEKPAEGYPLFLYMHGSGEKNREWQVGVKLCQGFNDSPSLYFIPQIPNTGKLYRWWQRAKQYAWQQLLRQAYQSGMVNANRVYFFGISEGAYGSQRLASFYGDYLAGAGPIAGGEPLINAPVENLANVAFTLTSGDQDLEFCRNRYTTITGEALDSMAALHPGEYTHRVFLQPGRNHHCDYSYTTPWLKTFVRNPYPKHFKWEDFAMDGVHRCGYYNLEVLQRPELPDSTRTTYEFTVKDNVIDLNVHNVRYVGLDYVPQWQLIMHFAKREMPATGIKLRVYLCQELVDLNKKVTVRVNGRKVFSGKVKCRLSNLVTSCAAFYDPCRLYPASVEIEL